MKDVLGKEIVGYKEACYLKEMGYNGKCTGYYHCDEYEDDTRTEDDRYECAGFGCLFKNSLSAYRAAAPTIRGAKKWYVQNNVIPFKDFE